MPNNLIQSAILDLQDQLFLDSAEGAFLAIVAGNLGLDKPRTGYGNDDHFRAVARKLILQPRSIRNLFYRILEICVGPQYSRVGDLITGSTTGDSIITVGDVSTFVQVGTAILDPGLATEETVKIRFKNNVTNQLFFTTETLFDHAVVSPASNSLKETALAGSTSLTLLDSSQFPITGYPYSILIDRGTKHEEAVTVSNNDLVTNVLTVSATTLDHSGPISSFLNAFLDKDSPASGIQLLFAEDDTKRFPYSGLVRLDKGGGNEEIVEYTDNYVSDNYLLLKTPLVNDQVSGTSVDLLRSGALVDTASIWQPGIYWDLYETQAKKVYINLPNDVDRHRIIDVSYLHDETHDPFVTTLASNVSIGDTQIEVVDASGFVDEAGYVLINGVGVHFYVERDETNNILKLAEESTVTYTAGDLVALQEYNYPGTDLEEGNPRDATGAVQSHLFPGPYVYSPGDRAPSSVYSTITTTSIPNIIRTAYPQLPGRTCLEVDDASMWPAAPFDQFPVRIGSNSGFEEENTVTDRTLKRDVITTTILNPDPFSIDCVDTSDFPESDGVHRAGYRVIIDRGGANEEIATVSQNVPDTLTFDPPLAIIHGGGEDVELLNDVLTFDPLTEPHYGPRVNPSLFGDSIHPYTSQIELVDGTEFPLAGGFILLNFGKGILNVRKRIISIAAGPIITLTSTADLPTSGYPYQIIIGDGAYVQEPAFVTNNDTALNQLTLADALLNTHVEGEYALFTSGTPESVEYTSKSGNILEFEAPVLLESHHLIGETVFLSRRESEPDEDGFDYALKLPNEPAACFLAFIDAIRAAGVQVIVAHDK